MDASGLFAFSALPLLPLMVAFWYWERLPRAEIGFVWGRLRYYAPALLHPVLVLGLTALTACFTGAINLEKTRWLNAWLNMALVTLSTILVASVTEEGFFRGWLWASLRRAGLSKPWVLLWTSLAFALWHLSVILLDTPFRLPLAQVPVFLLNAAVIGAIWGMLRMASGSVVVTSVAHGVWNGGAYVFFGFGTRAGALGITDTAIYGPEVGALGLVLNVLFGVGLWQWCKREAAVATA
jgi:membrane protease YdiL (CAAX protease family)